MKKYPTRKEMDALPGMTNAQLKGFAMQHGDSIPPSIKKKEDILRYIHRHLESPSNIVIDTKIPAKCKPPQGYDQNVWIEMVKRAKNNKKWAIEHKDKFVDAPSITNEMIIEGLKKSVFEIAKEKYDYLNYRAHATINDPGSWMHGHPVNGAALKEWEELAVLSANNTSNIKCTDKMLNAFLTDLNAELPPGSIDIDVNCQEGKIARAIIHSIEEGYEFEVFADKDTDIDKFDKFRIEFCYNEDESDEDIAKWLAQDTKGFKTEFPKTWSKYKNFIGFKVMQH